MRGRIPTGVTGALWALATAGAGALAERAVTGGFDAASLLAATVAGGGCALGWILARRSERGRLAEARSEAHSTRAEAAREREESDALLRVAAHDLRSPFGSIQNFVGILEDDYRERLGGEGLGLLARIRRASHTGLVVLDGLARLAAASREPLRRQRVDVEALVREALAELSPAPGHVEFSLADLPPALADPGLLRAAFRELLANALKFSSLREKAHVGVGGRREADASLVYWVADDGVGFDPRFAPRLFRAFERLHSRDEFPGAGVGLAIVRRVAERHGGRAWAEGDAERGARFFLALPDPKRDDEEAGA
jgi:light-regulated signal transduction histidine kinase (bacteriophytochrome)